MPKVLALKEDSFDGSDGTRVVCWKVELDDKTNPIPCYSAEASTLVVGEPLPAGWEVKVSAKGKDYLAVPKSNKGGSGGAAAFRNTEAGFRAEQDSISRSVALKAAVDLAKDATAPLVLVDAELFYLWLRQTSSGGVTPAGKSEGVGRTPPLATPSETVGVKEPGPRSQAQAPASSAVEANGLDEAAGVGEGGSGAHGEDAPGSPDAVHVHTWKDAPREGWAVCACGKAEMKSKLKASA